MSNKIHFKYPSVLIDDFTSTTTKPKSLINSTITFAPNNLIFIKLDNKYKLARILNTYTKELEKLEIARLLVIDNDYPNIKLYLLDVNESVEFFYADTTLLNKDILNLVIDNNLEKIQVKLQKLIAKRQEELDNYLT